MSTYATDSGDFNGAKRRFKPQCISEYIPGGILGEYLSEFFDLGGVSCGKSASKCQNAQRWGRRNIHSLKQAV